MCAKLSVHEMAIGCHWSLTTRHVLKVFSSGVWFRLPVFGFRLPVVRIPSAGRLSGSCLPKDALCGGCGWMKCGCKILKLNNFQMSELFVSVSYLFDWFIFHHFNPFHMFHRWRFRWSSWSVGGKSTHDGARLRKRRRLLVEQIQEVLKPF